MSILVKYKERKKLNFTWNHLNRFKISGKVNINFSLNKKRKKRQRQSKILIKNNLKLLYKRKILKSKELNNIEVVDFNFKDKSHKKELNTKIFIEKKVFNNSKLIKKSNNLKDDYDNDSDDSTVKKAIESNLRLIGIN